MKYIKGKARGQITLFPTCIDDMIDKDNEVRLIDAFVDSLDMIKMGFKVDAVEDGRPKYHPRDLLKIFIYGYLNKTRSSRDLEKACRVNIEMMWLVRQLTPDHNTINRFRKENNTAIRNVFRKTVKVASDFNLIGGTLIAGDSTKLRAQNSKKLNFNEKKIKRHQEYIERKLKEYQELLDSTQDEDEDEKKKITKHIETQNQRKDFYNDLSEKLKHSGEKQISLSDADSRQMIVRNNITEVAYNVQTTTDDDHNILIDYLVTNENDSKAMGEMLERAVYILDDNNFTSLYDKGYHTGSEFAKAEKLEVEVLVAIPAIPSKSQAPDPAYNKSEFRYNEQEDTYTCPEGQTLYPAPTVYIHKDKRKPGYEFKFKKYSSNKCKTCPALKKCTSSKLKRRYISRSEHDGAIERNAERMKFKAEIYKKRQTIVEHPYGTIKRQWGFNYVITKRTIERASADIGLIMSAYNLRRIFNILNFKDLMKYLLKKTKNHPIFIILRLSRSINHQSKIIHFSKLAA